MDYKFKNIDINTFNLDPRDSIDINIEKIISLVIELEKQNGLDMEEIKYKYTHGHCGDLARLIQYVLRVATGQKCQCLPVDLNINDASGNSMSSCEHMYIVIKDPQAKNLFDKVYYDILGKHHSKDYGKFTSDPYFVDKNLKNKYLGDNAIQNKDKWEKDFQLIFNTILEKLDVKTM